MILNHITQGSAAVVIAAPLTYAYLFGETNLHMINVLVVPQWFKHIIGKAKRHYVLHRLFSEVMIYAIQLLFGKAPCEKNIQLFCRCKISTERLLNHNAIQPFAVTHFMTE